MFRSTLFNLIRIITRARGVTLWPPLRRAETNPGDTEHELIIEIATRGNGFADYLCSTFYVPFTYREIQNGIKFAIRVR